MSGMSDVFQNRNVANENDVWAIYHLLDHHKDQPNENCSMCFPELKPINETPRAEPRFFLVGEDYFSDSNLPIQEELCLNAHRGTLALVQSVTNAGKSTFVRNLSFALATGEAFGNLIPENSPPRKVMLLNMEHTDPRSDLKVMGKKYQTSKFENFAVAHPQSPLSLSTAEGWERIRDAAKTFTPDVIVLDTFMASFDVRNENDNSEVTKLVKRVLSLAREFNALVILTHHIGKAVVEEGRTRDVVHRGRGASALAAAASSIFNLDADGNNWKRVRLSCAKNKIGKGQYSVDMLLGENRWFDFSSEAEPISRADKVVELLSHHGQLTTNEIAEELDVHPRSIRRAMEKLSVSDNRISSTKKGVWTLVQGETTDKLDSELSH